MRCVYQVGLCVSAHHEVTKCPRLCSSQKVVTFTDTRRTDKLTRTRTVSLALHHSMLELSGPLLLNVYFRHSQGHK